MKSTITWMKLFPILFGFFVMGFVDVVGIATNYVKKDFFLSDTSQSDSYACLLMVCPVFHSHRNDHEQARKKEYGSAVNGSNGCSHASPID